MMSSPHTPLDREDEEMDGGDTAGAAELEQFEQDAAAAHAEQPVPGTPPVDYTISTPTGRRGDQEQAELQEMRSQMAELREIMNKVLKKVEETAMPGAASVPPLAPAPGLLSSLLTATQPGVASEPPPAPVGRLKP